jgi:hypothetical protein
LGGGAEMKNTIKPDWLDERQEKTIMLVFNHAFWFAISLFYLNFILSLLDIKWTTGPAAFFLSGNAAFTYFAVKSIICGVYMGKAGFNRFTPASSLIMGAALVVFSLYLMNQNEMTFIHPGEYIISYEGSFVIAGMMYLLISACAFIQYFRIKKTKSDLSGEEGK